jgi:Leucine-rich repeat (LRR) protein
MLAQSSDKDTLTGILQQLGISPKHTVFDSGDRLIELNLSGMRIETLPPDINRLSHLEVFVLTNNLLTVLPPSLWGLTNLRQLWLDGNSLASLPDDIVRLTRLEVLVLSRNRLTRVPPALARLPHLEDLELSENPIRTPPPEIGQRGECRPGLFARYRC